MGCEGFKRRKTEILSLIDKCLWGQFSIRLVFLLFLWRLNGLQIVLKPFSPLAECDLYERIRLSSDKVFINHFAMISKEKLLPRNSFRHVCTHAKLSQKRFLP